MYCNIIWSYNIFYFGGQLHIIGALLRKNLHASLLKIRWNVQVTFHLEAANNKSTDQTEDTQVCAFVTCMQQIQVFGSAVAQW